MPGKWVYLKRPKKADAISIISEVSGYYDVSLDAIKSNRRHRRIVEARHMVMYILKKKTDMSLRVIGEMLGDRDHTTVIHGINAVKRLSDVYPKIKQDMEFLGNKFN